MSQKRRLLISAHDSRPAIIAKHRKGATGDVLLTFRGEYTRFENPEDRSLGNRPPMDGGEIRGSKVNGEDINPIPPIDNGPLPF